MSRGLDRAIERATTIPTRDLRAPRRDPEDEWWIFPIIWATICWPPAAILAVLHLFGVIPWTAALIVAAVPLFPVAFLLYAGLMIGTFGVALPWAWRATAGPVRRYKRLRRAKRKYALGHHTLAALESAVYRAYQGEP